MRDDYRYVRVTPGGPHHYWRGSAKRTTECGQQVKRTHEAFDHHPPADSRPCRACQRSPLARYWET